jgi:fatty acid desaturase
VSPSSTTDYSDLKRILTEAGLRDAQPWFYIGKAIFNAVALAGVIALALWSPHPLVLVASAVLYGVMLTQIGLLGHDVAHRQVFRRGRWVTVSGWILGNFLMGISYTWWTRKHNQHHAKPNHLTEDPDVDYPMLAFFPEQVGMRKRWAMPIIKLQAYLLPFLALFAFVTLRTPSISLVFRGDMPRRIQQAIGLALYWSIFALFLTQLGGWPEAIAFFFISQMSFSLYNVSVFAPNHKGMMMLSDDEPLDFLREQVLTARNVQGSPFVDFWYGGLNYQIEHHLFPTMPRNQLRHAQPIVEQFCAERGIPYYQTSLTRSYAEIFQHLKRAGAAA